MNPTENLTDAEAVSVEQGRADDVSLLSRGQRLVGLVLTGISWLAAVPLAAVALARVVAPDQALLLLWLNSFSLYLYLPAYPAMLWAFVSRRRGLALVAMVSVAGHVIWGLPDYRPPAAQPFDVQNASRLRIASGNAMANNRSLADWFEELRQADPDILLIQELSHELVGIIERANLKADMPYHALTPQRGWPGLAVYSKYPFDELELTRIGTAPLMVFTINHGGQQLRIYHIHNMAPMAQRQWRMWQEYWQHVAERLEQETLPHLLIGDFNTTQHAQRYRDLLATGLRSAHVDRGRGFVWTWPNRMTKTIPPIRIDHALLSPEIACLKISEGKGIGSDHRPLFLDLALPPQEEAGAP